MKFKSPERLKVQTVNFIKSEDVLEKIEALFSTEKEMLSAVLPYADIEHIGATSVPGTITKGDLDINVRIKLEKFQDAIKVLEGIYEINQPENWNEGFASFKDDSRDLGIQLTVLGTSVDYFVAQREYFKIHPEKVIELNALKKEFEGKGMDEYRKTKNAFLRQLPI